MIGALPRVSPSIQKAVMRYKNGAVSPYATVRAIAKKPHFYIPVIGLGAGAVGALGPMLITAFASVETAVAGKNIIRSKAPVTEGNIARALGVAGIAVGGALLHFTAGFAAATIGTIGLHWGLLIVGIDKLIRFIGKIKSVNQLKSLVKTEEDIITLKKELEKQSVPEKSQANLLRKLGLAKEGD